ncbi:MAG: universal stress protein [Desulfarculus sp.]|nr:universal stress protein [Desulfarculus sp.]
MALFSHIVCCSDFSPQAETALEAATEQARRDGARLTLLHVVLPGAPLLPGDKPHAADRLPDQEIVHRLTTYMRERYGQCLQGLDWRPVLRRGHPSEEILAQLQESNADLVVLGSQGLSGMGLVLLGSVAERVSRRAPCTCLIIRRAASRGPGAPGGA